MCLPRWLWVQFPRNHIRKLAVLIIPALGWGKHANPWVLWLAYPNQQAPCQGKTLSQNSQWKASYHPEEWHARLTSGLYMHIHIHAYTHIPTDMYCTHARTHTYTPLPSPVALRELEWHTRGRAARARWGRKDQQVAGGKNPPSTCTPLVMEKKEPEPSSVTRRGSQMGLEHQASHKIYDLQPFLPAICVGAMVAQSLWEEV